MSGYNIVKAESKDSEEILDFLNEHFVPHEPINAAIKLCEAGYRSVDCWWQKMTSYQDNILRMPYFDDWILGRINNTRTVTMLARAEAGSALLGLVIMDIVSAGETAEAEGAEAEAGLPRFRSCPERLATIFTFLDWVKRDLELGAEVEEDDIMIMMMMMMTLVLEKVPSEGS